MSCAHCTAAGELFDDRTARRDLKRYRKKGPSGTTRLLLDALIERGVTGASLLDIGGGVGAIQHELLAEGATSAVNVDASPAYQAAARSELERHGTTERVLFVEGDVVERADEIPEADIVTLDRVLCCYPDVDTLVDVSAGRARRMWGVVFPRERRFVRFGVAVINLVQRLRRDPFRVYVHSTERVRGRAEALGFRSALHVQSFLWQIRLFERPGGGETG